VWCVYIVRCREDSLYVGHSADVERRVERHNDGRGSRFTSGRRPVRLVYMEVFSSRLAAIARERQLKRWTRRKKGALAGDFALLKRL
jgi:putative endonuclease